MQLVPSPQAKVTCSMSSQTHPLTPLPLRGTGEASGVMGAVKETDGGRGERSNLGGIAYEAETP